jgi:hypothetical protein
MVYVSAAAKKTKGCDGHETSEGAGKALALLCDNG